MFDIYRHLGLNTTKKISRKKLKLMFSCSLEVSAGDWNHPRQLLSCSRYMEQMCIKNELSGHVWMSVYDCLCSGADLLCWWPIHMAASSNSIVSVYSGIISVQNGFLLCVSQCLPKLNHSYLCVNSGSYIL